MQIGDVKICSVCGGKLYGFKCTMCDASGDIEDPAHSCGPERCFAKCVGCGQVEEECTCAPVQKEAGPAPKSAT